MSCVVNWPQSYSSAAITVYGVWNNLDEDGNGFIASWDFENTLWGRRQLLPAASGINRCTLSGLGNEEFVATIDPCNPTLPTITKGAFTLIDPESGPRPIVGSYQEYLADSPVGDPLDVYGQVTHWNIGPKWQSPLRPDTITYSGSASQTVHIEDLAGSPIDGGQQLVWFGAASPIVALLGAVTVKWTEPSRINGGGRDFYWELSAALKGNITVATTSPYPEWPAWSYATTYSKGDVVSYSDINYEALKTHTATAGTQYPSGRADRWRVFDINNHVEISSIRNGARFNFVGRYWEATSLNAITYEAGTMLGSATATADNEVSVGYEVMTRFQDLTDPESETYGHYFFLGLADFNKTFTVTTPLPGDGNFAAVYDETETVETGPQTKHEIVTFTLV